MVFQDDLLFNMSSFPNLHSLRVSNSVTQLTTYSSPSATRFPVLQELTLNGYNFGGENMRLSDLWPEIHELKSLRLELCTFDSADDLRRIRGNPGQMLQRKTPKLQSLALFATRYPVADLGYSLVTSLTELWMKGRCLVPHGPHGSDLTAYTSLHSFHFQWPLFPSVFPPNLRFISVTIPQYYMTNFNYGAFETRLEELSLCLLALEEIRVVVHHRHPVLKDEIELRRKLQRQGVMLVVEKGYRGGGENSLVISQLIC